MISSRAILFSTTLVVLVSCGSLPVKDCGSKHGKVTSIMLNPAPVGRCTFPRGKNVSISAELEIDEVTSTLDVAIKGDVVVWAPFKLPNPNACEQGVTCPTISGSEHTLRTVLPILTDYPAIRLMIQMELKDDKGDNAICVQFPGEIC